MSFEVDSSHPVRVEAAPDNPITLTNRGATLYYAQSSGVSATTNDGSVADGGSLALTIPTYVKSASQSFVTTSYPAASDPSRVPSSVNYATTAYVDGTTGASLTTTLTSNSSVGASTITVSAITPPGYGFAVIEPFSTNCEVRQVSSVSGSVVTLSATLKNAHSSTVRVLFVQTPNVHASWWGAKGDNSTDDVIPLQNALRSISDAGLSQTMSTPALQGAGRIFRISQPLMLPNHTKLENINIFARSNYAPGDALGAMCMTYRGTWQTFTATASNDTFTTPAVHDLIANDHVILKGPNLPAGVTAGKVYFVKTAPTTTTFTISTTAGGATVDLTTDGSGDAYPDAQALCRCYMRDVFIDGNAISNVNGLRMNLQQPAFFMNLRISDCAGNGLWIAGQQAVFFNTELTSNLIGLNLDQGKFMWFFGFDSELNVTAQIKVPSVSESIFGGGGAEACLFAGVHMEYDASPKGIILNGLCSALTFENMWVSCPTGNVLETSATITAQDVGYSFKDLRLSTTAGATIINDQARGFTRTALHANEFIDEFVAEPALQDGAVNDESRREIRGQNVGYIRMGGLNPSAPRMAHRPDTAQTAPQEIWRDGSNVDRFWINVQGSPVNARTSAPADAELAAGQFILWFDQTNGASGLKIKAKQADGTVKTGTVSLA